MAGSDTTSLDVTTRSERGSRAMRRLRREGRVPGVIYGGEAEPLAFEVDARTLRNTLAHAHAVLDLTIDGGKGEPVIVKEVQRHPVRGDIVHADLLRVRMDEAIQTTVTLELTGADDAAGVKEGGVLSQELREVTVEALPGDLPDSITVDVAEMGINETLLVEALKPPKGVTIVDDPESVVATITPPTQEPVEGEIETETELVGEGVAPEADAEASAEAADRQAEGDTGAEAEQATGGDTE